MEEKILVSTLMGDIVAYPNTDPTHPGITVMLRQKSSGYEIDLVYIEAKEDLENPDYDPENLDIYCYEDVFTEDWTHKFAINREELDQALGD